MKLTVVTFLLLASVMVFAADKSSPAPAKPTTVEGGNGVTLPPPPPTEVKPVTETIHGVTVTDPYRWLEDGQSPPTRAWIAAQMKYTEDYLSQVKIRPEDRQTTHGTDSCRDLRHPAEAGGRYFFTKRLPGREPGVDLCAQGAEGHRRAADRRDQAER